MGWDFHAHSWAPDVIKPILISLYCFVGLAIGVAWVKLMMWSFDKKDTKKGRKWDD